MSFWARLSAPGAGKDAGVTWVPSVNDEVLVAFEHGDMDHPVVLGGLWNGKDTIPLDVRGGHRQRHRRPTSGSPRRTGHKISFFESQTDSAIKLITANDEVKIVLDDKDEELQIECTDKVDDRRQGRLKIKADGSMTLEAQRHDDHQGPVGEDQLSGRETT